MPYILEGKSVNQGSRVSTNQWDKLLRCIKMHKSNLALKSQKLQIICSSSTKLQVQLFIVFMVNYLAKKKKIGTTVLIDLKLSLENT